MANYKEIICAVKRTINGEEKTFWNRIGVAFPTKADDGNFLLKFDYFPTDPTAGIMLTDPKPRDGAGRSGGGRPQQRREREPGEDYE